MSAASASPSLVASKFKAASLLAAGPAAGVVSANVAALTEEVVKAMFVSKIKGVLAAVPVVVALFGATGLVCRTQAGEEPKADEKKGDVKKGEKAKTDDEQFQGVWTLTEASEDGKKKKIEDRKVEATLIVRNGTLYFKASQDGGTFVDRFFVYKLDPDPTPYSKMIYLADWKKGFERDDEIIQGVYDFMGDTISVAFGVAAPDGTGRDRLTSLGKNGGSKTHTWTFKKDKQKK